MTITLTPAQQATLMPLHLAATEAGGGLMMAVERVSFDQPGAGGLALRVVQITGEKKKAMIAALEKLKAKEEAKI